MNTIEFENKVFHALKGFKGYYASMDGEVLSTNKGTKILKHGKGGNQAYHFSQHNKITTVTKSRVIYMVQNNCSLADLNGFYTGVINGKAIKSENKKEIEPKRAYNPLKEIQALRNEIDVLETFYMTGDVVRLKAYIDSKFDELKAYGIIQLKQGREKVVELVNNTLSEFYAALYANRVSRGITAYIKGIMRKLVAVQRKERAMLLHDNFLYDKISLNDWAS